jgi:hypothetical protein
MNELSPTARELVESHRRGKVLARADRERIKQKMMLRVATLGATTAATGTAVGMSLVSKITLVALGVTALSGAGVLSLWALRGREPADVMSHRPASLPLVPKVVEPAPVVPEAELAPAGSLPIDNGRSDHPKKINKHPAVVAPANPSAAALPVADFDPEPELRLLREAREDLRAGRSESAYRRLDEYGRQHSGGMLAQERRALSAIAYCRWQPGPEAQTRAAEFLRNSPESPLANRVRSACEEASKPPH